MEEFFIVAIGVQGRRSTKNGSPNYSRDGRYIG